MWSNILGVCNTIATITGTAEGLMWVYQHAWPHIEPLWQSGLFCPERFWWDGIVLPVQRGQSPADIQSNLKTVLVRMHTDEKRIEKDLAGHSDHDSERIFNAYSKLLAEIRVHYPKLVNTASGVA